MNRIILTLVIGFFSTFLSAQTKFISHKSHSGKTNTFNINADGNLGWNPSMDKHYNYDSMLKMDSIQSSVLLKNNQQKLDSINKDSIRKDSVINKPNPRIPDPRMRPPKDLPKNPKSELINPQNKVNKMEVKDSENYSEFASHKNWYWLLTLLFPLMFFLFKKA